MFGSYRQPVLVALFVLAVFDAVGADIVWTRMTGQYPVECTPVLGNLGGNAAVVAVNRGGEVMVWGLDGADIGKEPDGRAAQLPKGIWSSSPAVIPAEQGGGIIACNIDGLVVALDGGFQTRWEFQLPGKTSFSCAVPVLLTLPGRPEPACVLCDQSGNVTCLGLDGKVVWQTQLGTGECDAVAAVFSDAAGPAILASAGPQLHRLDVTGKIVWSRELKTNVSSRAEVLDMGNGTMVLCGTAGGDLCAFQTDGTPLWTANVVQEVGNTIALLRRPGLRPLVLCTALWGNLYAFNENGEPVWTHVFRSKNRGRPAVADFNGDGREEVLLTGYNQHAFLVGDTGDLLDDVRLSGCLNGSPVLLEGVSGIPEVLTVDASLLAHRLRMGTPRCVFADTPTAEGVKIVWPVRNMEGEEASVKVENPRGALLRVNLRNAPVGVAAQIQGSISARSAFEVALPGGRMNAAEAWACTVFGADGRVVAESTWPVPARTETRADSGQDLRVWATPAYGLFDQRRLCPCSHEGAVVLNGHAGDGIHIENVYMDEVEYGAFVMASLSGRRVHIDFAPFKTSTGETFSGQVSIHELVPVGTVNGETVPDAMMDLGNARLTTLPPKQATKYWLRVDTHGAKPGTYSTRLVLRPLDGDEPSIELAVKLGVVGLRIPNPLPFNACAWDYVPNKWFPDRTEEVVEDMNRHGLNIFPRTGSIPKGSVDAGGQLSMDWTDLDVDLKRYGGRGTILFQLTEPPINFAVVPEPAKKREVQLRFLREWRDYLKACGRNYGDYAFYPVDEPGLGYGGNNVQLLIDSATLFREADANFRVYTDPVPGLSHADYKRLEPLIDVWCPNMRLMSGGLCGDPRVTSILGSGKTVWSYECVSQVRSLSPLCYNRANAWRADFFGLSGIGFWTHSTTQVNEWFAGKSINDEYSLVYPGPLPVPSVRWEAVRDGLEDVAAARMLQEAANAPGADPLLRQQALEELRMARTDAMELSDEAFIESRDFLRAGDRRIWHSWTDAENCARHRARMAELTFALAAQEATAEP